MAIRIFIISGLVFRLTPNTVDRPSMWTPIPWPNPVFDAKRLKIPGDVKRGPVPALNIFLFWPARVSTELATGEHALQCPQLNRAHRGAGDYALQCPALILRRSFLP